MATHYGTDAAIKLLSLSLLWYSPISDKLAILSCELLACTHVSLEAQVHDKVLKLFASSTCQCSAQYRHYVLLLPAPLGLCGSVLWSPRYREGNLEGKRVTLVLPSVLLIRVTRYSLA